MGGGYIGFASYIIATVLLTFLYLLLQFKGISWAQAMWSYANPIVIFASLSLFAGFQKLLFKNNQINNIASSAFDVYLLHACPFVLFPYYKPTIQTFYERYDGITFFGVMLVFLLSIFFFAILIDKVRIFSWILINKAVNNDSNNR